MACFVQQGAGEFEAEQVVAFGVADPNGACPEGASGPRQRCSGRQGGAGNLEQNLCRWRQGTAHSNQYSAGTDVKRGGKLQELLAFFVAAPYENGDRQGQSRPLSTFFFDFTSDQGVP